MSIKAFLAKDYWIGFPTSLSPRTMAMYLVVFFALFALGIAAKVFSNRQGVRGHARRVLSRFGNMFLSGAVVGGIILFFRYEYVPFLSLRVWFGVWGIWQIIWFAFILKYYFTRSKELANKSISSGDRERIEAFLPKRKK